MKRTRKWAFVAQEAQRLAELKLSDSEIARRLSVNQSTVSRWRESGKFSGRPEGAMRAAARVISASVDKTPAQWAASVRKAYDLDETDDQLVTMGESALLIERDPQTPAQLRLQAMGRFQAIAKQLALVARAADAKAPETSKRKTFAQPKRTGTDPRGILMGLG